ncbi:MAG: FG-GAP-like repeat-containing protein [Planctomycetia bacterium]|nr:FG-GAP-like repeat-containing protein [Planctomycetia bacterium]
MPAAPTVLNVTPATGDTLGSAILVQFSENVTGADLAANFKLFASDGTPVNISGVSYDSGTFTTTILTNSLSINGVALTSDAYSLFLLGDQIIDVDEDLALARPGEIVVANGDGDNLATAALTGSRLAALTTIALPTSGGTDFTPTAIARGDVDDDGLDDLVVTGSGLNRVLVYLGQSNGGFSSSPDAQLDLPTGASPSGLVVTNLDTDGILDIAVANRGTNNVSVFLNQTLSSGSVSFSTATNTAAGNAPAAIVVGLFNNDSNPDVAVANGTADGNNNFTINILPGSAGGTLGTAVAITVGNTTPTNLTTPNSLAAGRFDNNSTDDIVVGGANGISTLLNGNGATPTFTPTFVAFSGGVTSVATGVVRSNPGGPPTQDDVVATAASSGGQLVAFLNDNAGVFVATGGISAGISNPTGLQLTDLDGNTGLEAVYVNNSTTSNGLVSRSPIQAGRIADASNASPIVITSNDHGLVNGQRVTIVGVAGNTSANGTFYIQNVTPNTFELVGSTGNAAATANTGTWIALPGIITNVSGAGVSPIVITSPNHQLRTGQQITISNVGGNTNANGTFFITRIDANQFSLNGTTGNGAYATRTGTWALPVYPTGDTPVGVVLVDFDGDGINDAVTANKTSNSLSLYTGSGSAGVGDGTFLNSSVLNPGGSNPGQVAVGDLDGDSVPDLVTPLTGSDRVSISLGLAAGGYRDATTLTLNGNRDPVSVALGDVNGDGKLDILVANQQDNNVGVFLGIGNGTFQNPTFTSVGRTPTDVAVGDLNNDGDLDLLVLHNGSGGPQNRGVTIALGNGNGAFQPSVELLAGTDATAIAVADFNQDGNLDFVITEDDAPGRVRLQLGNGDGSFTNRGDFTVGRNPIDVIVGDVNRDGFVDVVTVSQSDRTSNNISVLLNNLGSGFRPVIHTTLLPDKPLKSVVAINLNSDPFLDLIVTEDESFFGNSGPNNVYLLTGVGDGSFINTGNAYTLGGGDIFSLTPSYVSVVSDPFIFLTTFNVVTTTVRVDLVRNGDFQARDLTGEQGNLTGWTTFKLKDSTSGSRGAWSPQTRFLDPFSLRTTNASPLSLTPVQQAVPIGNYQAMLDQQHLEPFDSQSSFNPNSDESYAGSHALYQDITIPANATSVRLTLSLYLDSFGDWSDTNDFDLLDYRTALPNQQVRVDIVDPNARDAQGMLLNELDVRNAVLQNLFLTDPNDPLTRSVSLDVDLSAFAGRTIRIRIATTNNQGQLIVGVDNVSVEAILVDTISPELREVHLRNPTFLASPNTIEQSTDPTIVGRVVDNASLNNVNRVIFDLANNGFGSPDDVLTTTFDSNGYFSITPIGLLPGVNTVPVQVVDDAGNVLTQQFSFILQGPSLVNWQAVGPGPIDVSAAGVDYSTVSGKITGIAVDPRDTSGNTIYISAGNGGVWRTTDGGANWQALTDNIFNASGQRVNAAVGSIAVATNGAVYASTGVDDISFTSRSGVGILKSVDDGRTWQVLGDIVVSGARVNIFAGARISKIVTDPTNPNIVYVAVSSWDDPARNPGIFKTSNGGTTWSNVLLPENMFNPGGGSTIGAGAPLASVTDIIIDPFNPGRVIIGLGNIGQVTADASAGVWKSINGGTTWEKIIGGDDPSIPNNTIPQGTTVGRISLAQGTGRVGDERVVYVLMATPPSSSDQPDGGNFLGLFKSKDNMLNFTKVMLREDTGTTTENFTDLNLMTAEGGTVGAIVVDASNPNVVYIGGANRLPLFSSSGPEHSLIRVDTGNMLDTTATIVLNGVVTLPNSGDDIDKVAAAARAPTANKYPSGADYTGEGVYWYDIQRATVNNTFSFFELLPGAIHRIAVDPQGRLLFGTENGIYRGLPLGFGYDFTSGGGGIIRGRAPEVPGMTITELNGNLQINDLTSVSIDPTDPSRMYISAAGVGSALTPSGFTSWQTADLTGPFDIPNAFLMKSVAPAPDAPPGTPTSVYRIWQFTTSDNVAPDLSLDAGESFGTTGSAGISMQDSAGLAPVLAINPVKVNVDGVFYDELLFGTDKVYLSRTGGNVWDAISPDLSAAGFVSALAFAPSADGVYYAGTDGGRVFFKSPSLPVGVSFLDITGNLQTQVGFGVPFEVKGITVDPNTPTTAYVMLSVPSGNVSVFRTTNAGASTGTTWTSVRGSTAGQQLPLVPAYKMVIDPRASTGAPNGRIYVATEVGVFVSTNRGTTWATLGQGLPAVPVVDLHFNAQQEILAAATQGRGVFTISTARSGPAIVSVTPTSPVNSGALTEITVTFNTPVDPRTFTAEQNTPARTVLALIALTSTDFAITRIKELVSQYQNRVANQGDINNALGYFFVLNPDGSIAQTTDPALPGVSINITTAYGELEYTAFLTSSNFYFNNPALGNGNNATWIESIWQDLLGRTSAGDSTANSFLMQLNAGSITRLAITRQIVGAVSLAGTPPGPNALTNPLHPLSGEFQTNLVASLFNELLGRNYQIPVTVGSAPEIATQVATLQRGGLLRNVVARIVSTTEAYQKFGNDYALPPGVHANALILANFTGTTDSFGKPILDLAIASSDNSVRIFQGKQGGGYSQFPTLTLTLPMGANPSDLAAGDFNNDGMLDLVVANSGTDNVSVFLNTRTMVGSLSFGTRNDFATGDMPGSVVVADINGGGNHDLLVANSGSGAGAGTVSLLLGLGTGGFASQLNLVTGLTGLTDLAVANVDGDVGQRPDLVVSAGNGLRYFRNTTVVPGGAPTFAGGVSLSTTPTTSVALGNLDTDADIDIAATSDAAGGQVLVFQNLGSNIFSSEISVPVGANPRSLQLGDMNGDGRLDLVVANDFVGGGVNILHNTTVPATSPPDTITFDVPIPYPVTGSRPSSLALGDTNHDGIQDVAIGYEISEFVSTLVGQQQGVMKAATDVNWLDWLFRSQAGRPFTLAERSSFVLVLARNALVYLNGPDGVAAPLSITPTDSSNLTYKLTFGPRLFDSGYRLFIGPNFQNINLKDFIDLNGTYTNSGNPMNQDRDSINGEVPQGSFPFDPAPGDRFATRLAINHNDNGRFVEALFADFQGVSPTGRLPDNAAFLAINNNLESARLASLNSVATTLLGSQEEVDNLTRGLFQRYLRRLPTTGSGSELETIRNRITSGQLSYRGLVVELLATFNNNEYFNNPTLGNGNNQTWINQIYADLLPGTPAPTFPTGQTRTQIANALVFSDAVLQRTASEYFLQLRGRMPTRFLDPALDETTSLVALLRQAPAAGQLTGDQKVIVTLIASAEYLSINGNSNFEWLRSVYNEVLGRTPPIDTTGMEFNNMLTALLANYTLAREAALTTVISNQEFRNRFYRDYYNQFLSTPGVVRMPTAAELAAQEAFYQSNVVSINGMSQTQRLESVVANILRSPEYFPLSGPGSSNSTWLDKIYAALLNRSTTNDPVAMQQLAFLNSQSQAQLSNARLQVALQVLTSTEYRQILITQFYMSYLNRPPTSAELTNLLNAMTGTSTTPGITQQTVLTRFLRHPEYFRLNT